MHDEHEHAAWEQARWGQNVWLARAMAGARHNRGPAGGRGRERGRGGWGRPDFAMGGWGGGAFFGRGARAGRGDVRAAILTLLAEAPMHGYQIMNEIAERSGGVWKPSPGSIYPTLQQLEDEGLVRSDDSEGRRTFQLTDEGRAYVESQLSEDSAPWHDIGGGFDPGLLDLRAQIGQVAMAVMQVAQAGTPEHVAAAHRILGETRGRLYRLLAEDGPTESEPGTGDD